VAKVQNGILEITGTGVIVNEDVRIVSIQAIASADSSACVIQDRDGVEIAIFKSDVTGVLTFPAVYFGGKTVKGVSCGLWTNMEKVIVHVG
jgi:hypothetical protein